MTSSYYKPCKELNKCLELDKYWHLKEFDKWFNGYLKIANETSYALAKCQVGFSYLEGIGTDKDLDKALYWIQRSANHGDRDGQCNLAWIYEEGFGVDIDLEKS